MYFSQRRPRELANFEWIIDAKDPMGPTSQEDWWRTVIGPMLESKSISEPFKIYRQKDTTTLTLSGNLFF
jgi:hypothetical protein